MDETKAQADGGNAADDPAQHGQQREYQHARRTVREHQRSRQSAPWRSATAGSRPVSCAPVFARQTPVARFRAIAPGSPRVSPCEPPRTPPRSGQSPLPGRSGQIQAPVFVPISLTPACGRATSRHQRGFQDATRSSERPANAAFRLWDRQGSYVPTACRGRS